MKPSPNCFLPLSTLTVLLTTLGASAVHAQSITATPDGTGTQINQIGNQFDITGGTPSGANLYQSFQQFGLNQGQIANFLSNPNIQNILGRVTGGDASVINGLIQVTGGNSNLFLMNPAGIVFGSDASLNVPAAFTATTANGIWMGNSWFNAVGNNDYAALTGTPNSFAFLNNSGAIINAGNLSVGQGQGITLLGGIVINTGTISAPGGTITVGAVPGSQLVQISQEGSLLSVQLPVESQSALNPATVTPVSLPQLLTGKIGTVATGVTVENGVVKLTASQTPIPLGAGTAIVSGTLTTASTNPSTINVLGNKVGLIGANLDASGTTGGGTILVGGDYQGKGTVPTAQSTYVSPDSVLKADALTRGNGGKVIVWADGNTRFAGTISAKGGVENGNGGFVETSGKTTLDVNGGQADASAPSGQAGTWLLDPTDITIINGGSGSLTGGVFDPPTTSTISPTTIQNALNAGTNVSITTASGTGGNGDITLANSINQMGGGAASLTLTGRRFANPGNTTISMTSTGGLTFNLNQVNPEANAPTSSVQSAINAIGSTVNGPRTINLGAGTYSGSTLSITKALTLNGAGAGSTILSGNNARRVLNITSNTATVNLNALTITQGTVSADPNGGGISKAGSGTLNVSNSTLSGNSAGQYGGGIYINGGTTTISNSTLSGNSASQFGGGIYINAGTATISNSTLSGNSASGFGGGIRNFGGTAIISNSTLSGNSASQGGGIGIGGGTTTISNSTLSGNVASQGGGIYINAGTTTISNSTLSGNSASSSGGGIYNIAPPQFISLRNSIIAGNMNAGSPDVFGNFSNPQNNLIGNATGSTSFTNGVNGNIVGTSVAPVNPKLAPLGNYGGPTQTHALLPGSLAINAGAPTGAPPLDQRGAARVGNPDMGAYEATGFALQATAGSGQSTTVNTAFGTALQSNVIETAFNTPIPAPGITVTFTAPSSGASLLTTPITAVTDASGKATAPVNANTIAGNYVATASTPGITGTANFNLTNNPDVPSSITAIGGTPQSAVVNTNYTQALQVTVRDQFNNVIPNATVSFSVPSSGASGTLTSATVTTDAAGNAAVNIKANTVAGNFNTTGNVTGVATPATFSLTNLPDVPFSLTASNGSGQSTTVNTNFANPLQTTVRDQYGNLVPNATLIFAAPSNGASATLNNPSVTADSNGQASVTATANGNAGNYIISVLSNGITIGTFSLTNQAIPLTPVTPAPVTPDTSLPNLPNQIERDLQGKPIRRAVMISPVDGPVLCVVRSEKPVPMPIDEYQGVPTCNSSK